MKLIWNYFDQSCQKSWCCYCELKKSSTQLSRAVRGSSEEKNMRIYPIIEESYQEIHEWIRFSAFWKGFGEPC